MAQIPQKKLRLVPLQIRNFWSAVLIARSCFGDETAMIVFSYLWYFWRNLRLPDFGLMARRQSMTLMSRRAPIALADIVTTGIPDGVFVGFISNCFGISQCLIY